MGTKTKKSSKKERLINALSDNDESVFLDTIDSSYVQNAHPHIDHVYKKALEQDRVWAVRCLIELGFGDIDDCGKEVAQYNAPKCAEYFAKNSKELLTACTNAMTNNNYSTAYAIVDEGAIDCKYDDIRSTDLKQKIGQHMGRDMPLEWIKCFMSHKNLHNIKNFTDRPKSITHCFFEEALKNNDYKRIRFVLEEMGEEINTIYQNALVENKDSYEPPNFLSEISAANSTDKAGNCIFKHLVQAKSHTDKSLDRTLYNAATHQAKPEYIQTLLERGADPTIGIKVKRTGTRKKIVSSSGSFDNSFCKKVIKYYKDAKTIDTMQILDLLKQYGYKRLTAKPVMGPEVATPIKYAAQTGNKEVVKGIEQRVSLNKSQYDTIIERALLNDRIDTAAFLVDKRPSTAKTLMASSNIDGLKGLVDFYDIENTDKVADIFNVLCNKAKQTALRSAIDEGRVSFVKNLVQKANTSEAIGLVAFDAIDNGELTLARKLIENTSPKKALTTYLDRMKRVPDFPNIHLFIYQFNLEFDRDLISSLLVQENQNSERAITLACELKQEHNVSIEEKGGTALANAYEADMDELVTWLKEQGVSESIKAARSI